MIPKLYESTEMEFVSNGLGSLPDAISCKVTEERNGAYELEMEYPVGGLHYDLIENNRIIYAKPNETSDPQPFDIKEITPSMDKMTATIYAQHVRYRMNGIPVSPFSAQGINDALAGLKQNSLIKHPFTFYTDIVNGSSKFNVGLPGTLGSLLGGTKGSILDTFSGSAGCEYEFDKFTVKLHAHRGTDSGVSIRYAKNLTGCKMESSIESVYTGVLAFWQKEEDGKEQLLSSDIQYIANHSNYPREYIYMLDCSSDFEDTPTVEQLNAKASDYAVNNRIGEPSVSVDVSFIPLWGTEEYKAIAPLERVCLCDTATVRFDLLGVNVKAIVNKTVYDVLAERYESISIGSAKSKLGETIKQEAHDQAEAVKKDTISAVQGSIDKAVDKIRGGTNGHVILSVNANGETNELYAYDGNSLETASKILRLNYEGIAGTDKGVNGKYNVAITTDGQINASSIKFGEMDGNLIKAKTLQIGSFDEATENTITSSLSEAVTEWYVSTSPTELKGGSWSESRPAWTETNYIWQRLRTENKKGEISYSEPSCVQGNTGAKGDKGEQGVQGADGKDGTSVKITAKSVTYQASTSGTTTPTGTWLANPPAVAKGQYLWTKTVVTYSDGNSTTAYSVAYQGTNGTNGQNGSPGRGVKSTEVTYQIWKDGTSTPNGTWQTTVPDTTADKPYLWTRTVITYTDDTKSTSYSVGSTLKGVNVGGRNFIKNGNFSRTGILWIADAGTLKIINDDTYDKCLDVRITGHSQRIYYNVKNFWKYGKVYSYSFMAKIADTSLPLTELDTLKYSDTYISNVNIQSETSISLDVINPSRYIHVSSDITSFLVPGQTYELYFDNGSSNRAADISLDEATDLNFNNKTNISVKQITVVAGRYYRIKFYANVTDSPITGTYTNKYTNVRLVPKNKHITVIPSRSLADNGYEHVLDNSWKYYHGTIFSTVTAESGTLSLRFSTLGVRYLITNVKLELGNIATDWTPAPEDVDEGINNAQSSADKANTNASNAQNAANNAQDTANKADAKADQAISDAASASTAAQIAKKQADAAQTKSDEANRIANGAAVAISPIAQVVKVDEQGLKILNSKKETSYAQVQSTGLYVFVDNEQRAVFGATSKVENLAVQDYLMFGAHRAELKIEDGEEGTALFHVGDIK